MPQLESEELIALINKALPLVRNKLFIANANGELAECLSGFGLSELLADEDSCRPEESKYGRIIVIGDSMVDERHLRGRAEGMGILKNRLEFIGFREIKRNDIRIWQHNTSIAAILCGPVPHMGEGIEDASGIVTALEDRDSGYPPVKRMDTGHGLKITKKTFSEALLCLLENDIIRPDLKGGRHA
jgi:hypothetical protein